MNDFAYDTAPRYEGIFFCVTFVQASRFISRWAKTSQEALAVIVFNPEVHTTAILAVDKHACTYKIALCSSRSIDSHLGKARGSPV